MFARSGILDPRIKRRLAGLIFLPLISATLAAVFAGCSGGPPKSKNYFALEPGNTWLYEGVASFSSPEFTSDAPSVVVEIKALEPDPSLELGEGILDMTIKGSLGNFKVSEEGLFLEITDDEVKLWGVERMDESPRFFDEPYVWLRKPLEVGREYNTAIQGKPTPAVMEATEKVREATPWGEMAGFELEEKGGADPQSKIRLTFVPYLGFTRVVVPELADLQLERASLR